MRAVPAARRRGPLSHIHSFLACEGALVSAIKPAARGDGLVVRFYNPAPAGRRVTIRTALPVREAREVTLGEEEVGGPLPGGPIEFTMGPFQIRTIKLVVERGGTAHTW